MKVDGACHCGQIRYEAEVDPARVIVCHCTDCQTLSGSAFRVVAQTLPGTFRMLAGRVKIYTKTGESGAGRDQAFCAECGTPIFSRPAGDAGAAHGLRVGTITQRADLTPSDQYWARSAQAWVDHLGQVHRHRKQPVFRPDGSFED